MSYLILQIVLWLVAAALLGFGFGWLLARRDVNAKVEEERSAGAALVEDWKNRRQEALDLADAARQRIAALENDIDALRRELHGGPIARGADDAVAQLRESLAEREAQLALRGEAVERCSDECERLRAEVDSLRSRLRQIEDGPVARPLFGPPLDEPSTGDLESARTKRDRKRRP